MWIKTAKIQNFNLEDYDKLTNFIYELRGNSMYRFVVDDLKQRPGFIRKEYSVSEDLTSQTFYSSIVFDTEENLKNYTEEEAIQSLWEFLELSATQRNFTYECFDKEL